MFCGRELHSILVTDYSNKVTIWEYHCSKKTWSDREIFRGDYPVTYAETNGDGKQLLIIESVSSGDASISGSVYSVETGEKWYELGSDYKWLGATFLNEIEVGVSKHWTWTNVFRMWLIPLSQVTLSRFSGLLRPAAAIADGQRQDQRWVRVSAG